MKKLMVVVLAAWTVGSSFGSILSASPGFVLSSQFLVAPAPKEIVADGSLRVPLDGPVDARVRFRLARQRLQELGRSGVTYVRWNDLPKSEQDKYVCRAEQIQ